MECRMTLNGVGALQLYLQMKQDQVRPRCERAMVLIGNRWQTEARLRVPVDTGLLRNTIMKEAGWDEQGPYCKVGSNQKYAKYTEFGTQFIAGGRVKALGLSEDITDAQAVKLWPAKNAGLVSNLTGKAFKIAYSLAARVAAGGQQEQMPWLRPSLNAIKQWALGKIIEVFKLD